VTTIGRAVAHATARVAVPPILASATTQAPRQHPQSPARGQPHRGGRPSAPTTHQCGVARQRQSRAPKAYGSQAAGTPGWSAALRKPNAIVECRLLPRGPRAHRAMAVQGPGLIGTFSGSGAALSGAFEPSDGPLLRRSTALNRGARKATIARSRPGLSGPTIKTPCGVFSNCARRGAVVYPSERLQRFRERPIYSIPRTSPAASLQLGPKVNHRSPPSHNTVLPKGPHHAKKFMVNTSILYGCR